MSAEATGPSWHPDPKESAASHIGRLMARRRATSVADLHAWSVAEPEAFWSVAVEDIGIEFDRAPDRILVASDRRHPTWFPGARLNIVRSCLAGDPSATALIAPGDDGPTRITLGELRSAVERFAAGFADAGYRPGDRIGIVMPMTVEAVVAYLGVIAAGGVVVSVADSFASDEIAIRFDITRPVAIVTQDVAVRAGKQLDLSDKCRRASSAPCIVVDTGAGVPLRAHDVTWREFQGGAGTTEPVSMSPHDHTNILFSSGTTGRPKAIPWTHTTPIKAAMDGRFHHDIHSGDVVAWPTNLGWMMGPWLIHAALLNDAALVVYADAPTTPEFVRFVRDAGVTMLGLVPSIVSAWRASGAVGPGDLDGVRVLSSTGEASNPEDYRWLMGIAGAPVIEYCGGTEVGGGYLTGTVVQPATASRFTTPALGIGIEILDESGAPADSGECFLVGPSIGLSTELLDRDHDAVYHEGVPEGLRRHGDHIERLDDGTYRARGRVDDTMNIGGIKVSSAELEEVLVAVPGVREVAAVAVPPDDGGPEDLVVFVVAEAGMSADVLAPELRSAIRSHLNPLFRISDVVLVEALPRTASHKVMRRVLRDTYRS